MAEFKAIEAETRRKMANKALEQHPEKRPLIVDRHATADPSSLPAPRNVKFLVPETLSIASFMRVLRRQLKTDDDDDVLLPQQALYMYTEGGSLCMSSSSISTLYEQHRNEDGFLYLSYLSENTFGGGLDLTRVDTDGDQRIGSLAPHVYARSASNLRT